MAAYRQSKVVVGKGKKLATLINKRNKIVKIRTFIGLFFSCHLIANIIFEWNHTLYLARQYKYWYRVRHKKVSRNREVIGCMDLSHYSCLVPMKMLIYYSAYSLICYCLSLIFVKTNRGYLMIFQRTTLFF